MAIRRHFPLMRVDYIRVSGRECVKSPEERFDSIDMLGPLMQVIPRAINAVLDDVPKTFRLPANSNRREDVPLIPRTTIREAIVNAVMHAATGRAGLEHHAHPAGIPHVHDSPGNISGNIPPDLRSLRKVR